MPRLLWPSLALNDDERHAFVGHFHCMRVAQLMVCKAPSHADVRGRPPQLGACRRGGPWPAARRTVDEAEHRADRELEAKFESGLQLLPSPHVHPYFAAAAALAATYE
jgi:hypothetical protein